MSILIIVFLVAAAVMLIAFPQLWVRRVIEAHSTDRPDFPGTGGEFARHVLDEMGLKHVTVEQTERGDHYDPETKAVRLSPKHFDRKSLAAVVIAAHEVGHAMQDATSYGPLRARTRLAKSAQAIELVAAALMFVSPLVFALVKSPAVFLMEIGAAFLVFAFSIGLQFVTLPVEFDASFGRALPVLEEGRYLSPADMPAARKILKAAAYTYVAAALIGLLNVARWLKMLRF